MKLLNIYINIFMYISLFGCQLDRKLYGSDRGEDGIEISNDLLTKVACIHF